MFKRTLATFQISYKDKLQYFLTRGELNRNRNNNTFIKNISYKDKVESNKIFPMNQNVRKNISFRDKLESKY